MRKNPTIDRLNALIRTVPDFPKKGIQFKDITPLLADRNALGETTRALAEPFRHSKIDFVLGLESRGFLFGTNLAFELGAGFVPVRKPGKLPAKTVAVEYDLEYGTDRLEIHADAFPVGANVLIHDDIIATGGTAEAAAKLVHALGGHIVGYSFIMELSFLNGRQRLGNATIDALIVV